VIRQSFEKIRLWRYNVAPKNINRNRTKSNEFTIVFPTAAEQKQDTSTLTYALQTYDYDAINRLIVLKIRSLWQELGYQTGRKSEMSS